MKVEDLFRIGKLFDEQGWPLKGDDGPFPELFDRFCRMCNRLNANERRLIIELSSKYVWMHEGEYRKLLNRAWDNVMSKMKANIRTIAFVPMLIPGRKKKLNSSSVVWYMARGNRSYFDYAIKKKLGSNSIELAFFQNLEDFGEHYIDQNANSNVLLLLIDDYVGSGSSAKKCILEIKNRFPVTSNCQTMVLSLVTQQAAIDRLAGIACTLVAGLVMERGISDNANLASKPNALAIMKNISRRFELPKNYELGFKKTEALVTMIITPNNTFPVFWTDKKVDNRVWDSPFTRYTNED